MIYYVLEVIKVRTRIFQNYKTNTDGSLTNPHYNLHVEQF